MKAWLFLAALAAYLAAPVVLLTTTTLAHAQDGGADDGAEEEVVATPVVRPLSAVANETVTPATPSPVDDVLVRKDR